MPVLVSVDLVLSAKGTVLKAARKELPSKVVPSQVLPCEKEMVVEASLWEFQQRVPL